MVSRETSNQISDGIPHECRNHPSVDQVIERSDLKRWVVLLSYRCSFYLTTTNYRDIMIYPLSKPRANWLINQVSVIWKTCLATIQRRFGKMSHTQTKPKWVGPATMSLWIIQMQILGKMPAPWPIYTCCTPWMLFIVHLTKRILLNTLITFNVDERVFTFMCTFERISTAMHGYLRPCL